MEDSNDEMSLLYIKDDKIISASNFVFDRGTQDLGSNQQSITAINENIDQYIFDTSTTLDTALHDYWSFAELLEEKFVNSGLQGHLQIATLTTSLYVGDECYSNIDELYNDNQTNLTLKVKAARLHSLPDNNLKGYLYQSIPPPALNLNDRDYMSPPHPAPNLSV